VVVVYFNGCHGDDLKTSAIGMTRLLWNSFVLLFVTRKRLHLVFHRTLPAQSFFESLWAVQVKFC